MSEEKHIKKLANLVDLQKKYIELIGAELDEIAPQMLNRGWESTRVTEGRTLRKRIQQLELEICERT